MVVMGVLIAMECRCMWIWFGMRIDRSLDDVAWCKFDI